MADQPKQPKEGRSNDEIRTHVERMRLEPWYLDVRGELVKPDQVVIQTRYFWEKWARILGPLPTMLLLRLRQYCYYNRATGEKRDWCYPSQEQLGNELGAHRDTIRNVVQQHHAHNARVFGSVLHGEDTDDSDLDLLVDPTAETTLMDIGAIRYKLRKLLGVPVDVLTPKALPDHFRQRVLAEAVPV